MRQTVAGHAQHQLSPSLIVTNLERQRMKGSDFKLSGVTSWAKEAVESVGHQVDGAAERINKWASAGMVSCSRLVPP